MDDFLRIGILPIVLTLAVFQIGQLCQRRWKKPIFNPTLIGMILVVVFLLVTGMDPQVYATGTAHMAWLMTPATISLAIPMYEQFQVLRKNLSAVVLGVAAGTVACMAFLLACGLLLRLDPAILVSLLPKSVTTIVTGILGNMLGTTLCRLFRITDPIAQGVAIGTSAHVIGTSKAGELSPLTGAASSLSLVVAGLLTAVLFPLLAAAV